MFFRFGARFDAFLEYLSNFGDIFSAIFDEFGGSDSYFDTVLTRCPSIFAIFCISDFVHCRDLVLVLVLSISKNMYPKSHFQTQLCQFKVVRADFVKSRKK